MNKHGAWVLGHVFCRFFDGLGFCEPREYFAGALTTTAFELPSSVVFGEIILVHLVFPSL